VGPISPDGVQIDFAIKFTPLPQAPNTKSNPNARSKGAIPPPTQYAYTFRDSKSDKKIAYITIDDGPSRTITPLILDILKEERVKATFFVLPHEDVDDIYRRIIDEGHEIGNHSSSHNYSIIYSRGIDAFKDDVLATHNFLLENFGYTAVSFRFPGGAGGRKAGIIDERRDALAELGYRAFDWNIDTGDAYAKQKDKSAAALTRNVLNNTNGRDRVIILMHDTASKKTTVEALPMIIAGLREQGYTFDILRNY
jgi:peptidoglycan/xylan/chitin deacetylase (PgdA/CDA1 family)